MTGFELTVEGQRPTTGFLDVSGIFPEPATPPLYRVNHDTYPFTRLNVPEVHSLFPNHYCEFGEPWQRLERRLNDHLSNSKWRAGHNYRRAMNNGTHGYEGPGEPLADYINGLNVGKPNPRQEALVMGGTLLAGYEEGANLVVDALDCRGPVPRFEDLKIWHWFTAVNIDADASGKVGIIRRFMNGEEFRYLILTDRTRFGKVTLPLSKVTKLDMTKPLPSVYEWP